MTPRQAALVNAADRVSDAKLRVKRILPGLDQSIVDAWERDVVALELARATVMAVAADPDAFGQCMALRAKSPAAFEAIMVLVKIELDRPAPAEQARAA